jgi:surface antigen
MILAVGALLTVACCVPWSPAHASTTIQKHHGSHGSPSHHSDTAEHSASKHWLSKTGKARYARGGGGGVQCVTFARATSGIALKGNAANWWDAASGVYERGSEPEPGSILNFRATGRMRLGHVAVVTNVLSSREIEIDHANWNGFGASKGNVSRGIRVQDVSENNNWTAVRVGLGHSEDFGSVYPTYGFIYDRPDHGTMVANTMTDTRRPIADRVTLIQDEVAQAPLPNVIYPSSFQPLDAPDHSFR